MFTFAIRRVAESASVRLHGLAVIDRRPLADLAHRVLRQRGRQHAAGAFGAVPADAVAVGERHLARDEVAKRIRDRLAVPELHALDHVRVMADDHRRAGVDQRAGLGDLLGRRDAEPLLAPVRRDDHVLDLASQLADLPSQPIHVQRRDAPPPGPGHRTRAASLVGGAEKRQANPARFDDRRGGRLGKVVARAETCDAQLVQQIGQPAKARLEAVEHVIVRQRDDVEPRSSRLPHKFRRGDHARLGIDGSPVAAQRGFHVAEDHVTCGEQFRDARENATGLAHGRAVELGRQEQVADRHQSNRLGRAVAARAIGCRLTCHEFAVLVRDTVGSAEAGVMRPGVLP